MNELTECNQAPSAAQSFAGLPAQRTLTEDKADPGLERHRRKCRICRHPDREEMEQEYVEWFKPAGIARHYDVPERALYRHFEAVGLVSSRRANLVAALENIVERGAEAPITGSTVIRAVKAICCVTGDNKWTEPAKNIVHSVQTEPKLPQEDGPRLLGEGFHQLPITSHHSQISNRQSAD